MPKTMLARKALPAALLALGFALPVAAQMPAPSNSSNAAPNASAPDKAPNAGAPTTRNGAADTTGSSTAAGGAKTTAKISHADRKFIEEAAKGGMAEVELAKVAKEHASNDQVRKFAERMEQDHSKANEELRQLAQEKGVTLPADAKASEHHEANKLAKMQGDKFDREYMKHMVKDHKKDVKEFEKEANKAKDPDVRNFAAKTLPTLQEHLQLAQNTDQAVGGKPSGKSSGAKARNKTAG